MPWGEEGQSLAIQDALAWLRRELLEMQRQDEQLLEKLLKLHTALRELKVECADWEGSEPSRDGFATRARSSSEDLGVPFLPGSSLKCGASRRNSLP
ncbi:uncharacterized protein C20orf202 homolog [Heteronotia binoei]|uniref:uncharacterized protein C20orf202 homolog n=1 Tax=Heteronotia binoei TaxID=13085 RepID=UPI00292EE8EB|nr:uncharacterized protein C20orf202 homolog [Heteronotia binoei]